MFRCGRFALDLAAPVVMGIVNLTPDSFSDGGAHEGADEAIRHAGRLIDEGAGIIDLGAESTRPGAAPVPAEVEWARLAPVLAALAGSSVPMSVDTFKPEIMRRALDAGASMINDVAGFADPDSRDAVVGSDCGLCVMHMRGRPQDMQVAPHYDDVVGEVGAILAERCAALVAAGVSAERICIDPGFGFGKTLDHNLALLRGLDALVATGYPVLVGLSRKGMIGALTGRPVGERVAGSVAAALMAVERGARIVRVHDVAATVDALTVWQAFLPPLEGEERSQRPVIASPVFESRRGSDG